MESPALREADLAHHLPAQDEEATTAPPLSPRPALESTRLFGTDDDKALATAVAMLAPVPGLASDATALLPRVGWKIGVGTLAAVKNLQPSANCHAPVKRTSHWWARICLFARTWQLCCPTGAGGRETYRHQISFAIGSLQDSAAGPA